MHDTESKLVMYFTVNTAFVNYIDEFNLTEALPFPVLTNKTTFKQTLPVFLNDTSFDTSLLSAPSDTEGLHGTI